MPNEGSVAKTDETKDLRTFSSYQIRQPQFCWLALQDACIVRVRASLIKDRSTLSLKAVLELRPWLVDVEVIEH